MWSTLWNPWMLCPNLMCICVLQFSLHCINYRWSRKFVYSPLSFHYKYIVSHSTVSHLVRAKDQIKLCKSIEDLSCNFIFCDHHMWPLLHTQLHFMVTLTKDCNLQKKEVYTSIDGSFLQEFNFTCLSPGRLLDFSDYCEHWLLI